MKATAFVMAMLLIGAIVGINKMANAQGLNEGVITQPRQQSISSVLSLGFFLCNVGLNFCLSNFPTVFNVIYTVLFDFLIPLASNFLNIYLYIMSFPMTLFGTCYFSVAFSILSIFLIPIFIIFDFLSLISDSFEPILLLSFLILNIILEYIPFDVFLSVVYNIVTGIPFIGIGVSILINSVFQSLLNSLNILLKIFSFSNSYTQILYYFYNLFSDWLMSIHVDTGVIK
jgi:hypothetical protein